MATNPFAKAHFEKIELNKKTAKKLQRAYSTTAKEVKNKLALLPNNTTSDSLKKLYLEGLLKDLNNSISDLEKYVQTTILDATEASGQIAVKASEELMSQAGLEIKGAFSYVPQQEMANILSGKLYGSDWSFSKAIWGMEKKTKDDLEKIVARGLAENRPIYDIAKDLEKYVDPSAKKPWDWSKVYPGTSKTVDYNAQRLARTMIQHAYQNSMVQAQRYNPFCKGIIWHSVGLHGRTCEVCEARDGQTFPVEDLPLDHPNGLCYFEPAIDKMDDVADRLADWVNGKDDPALDTYVSKAFNLNPKSPIAAKTITTVKEKSVKESIVKEKAEKAVKKARKEKAPAQMDKTKFVDTKFKNLKAQIIRHDEEEGEKIWAALRDRMITLDEDQLRYMSISQSRLDEITYGKDAYFRYLTREKFGKGLINMDLEADMLNMHGKGDFTTFFHEYGHLVDHFALNDGSKFSTRYRPFRENLYKLLKKEYNNLCIEDSKRKVLVLPSSVKRDLLASHSSNGVQDIISGLSLNRNLVYWGHSTDYWRGKGQEEGVVLEAMAHFNAAWANPQSEAYMEKYFPESYKYFKDEAIKFVRGAMK